MSSDSDDTELLLLIPPNFFLDEEETHCIACGARDAQNVTMSRPSDHTDTSNEQLEIEKINERIMELEKCSPSSNISSASNWGAFKNINGSHSIVNAKVSASNRMVNNFSQSTPKSNIYFDNNGINIESPIKSVHNTDKGVLSEIDHFFEDSILKKSEPESKNQYVESTRKRSVFESNSRYQYFCKPPYQLSSWESQKPHKNDDLISLNEIWGNDKTEPFSYQEERLRRKHCEKTIQNLQTKLLEYQQMISVAVEVDKTKDVSLKTLRQENENFRRHINKLEHEVQILEEKNHELNFKLKTENDEFKSKNELLEKDLSHTLKISKNFQDKANQLELRVDMLTKSSIEIDEKFKKKVLALEQQLSTSQKSEDELKKKSKEFQIKMDRSKSETDKMKNEYESKLESLEGEVELLKQQKQNVFEKLREERNRIDILEKRKLSLEEICANLNLKEANHTKENENLKALLKSHYQKQLDLVVSQKLKEFQLQLDTVEEKLKSEAKQRENILAERALKQIEMINQKNEQEIALLQEKQHEEIELYRIQLLNASKSIKELEEKNNLYKCRRAEIAEKLHSLMETQWQKAIEILASPSAKETFTTLNTREYDVDKLDGVRTECNTSTEKYCFETPNKEETKPHDETIGSMLRNYIEMLLSKSPRELKNLEDISKIAKYHASQTTKLDSRQLNQTRRESLMRKPWK